MADWINEQVKSWPVQTHEPAVLDDMSSVDIVKAKVDAVRAEAMQVYKVSESQLLCDFTGMGKPATAGMVLACAPRGRRLSYLQGKHDSDGKLQPNEPSVPVEIEIEYQVASATVTSSPPQSSSLRVSASPRLPIPHPPHPYETRPFHLGRFLV